ncbi:preprotein translocase subunit TatA [Knoellia sinensis KCTC 19936]|uniref:Sec-independent protein translocase protein TatA n=1 Tax=Knoellia sinensis KCTC 19936 TaxID=1385520 RepID=A0A0A0J5P3_9MICO|nr:Sec-independent protein translocase subunit TatA [Knoellia sinensis]KGN32670.1 preprotein translocase subunit TatA [Knoellia sinensis KCTC 19936]
MLRNFGAPEIIIIAVLLIVIFGWKRLPDAARSLGRSARVFKSEVDEMKADGKAKKPSETVPGETVRREADDAAPRATSPIDENAPRTDNQSGPTSGNVV